jgi:hypothetical protein
MSNKIDLVVAVPTAGTVPMGFAHSLAALMAFVCQYAIRTMPEITQVMISMDIAQSSNWITNREQLVHRALEAGRTHLMFLDDDMKFEPQVLEIMLGRRQPIVVTNYLMKTPEPEFMAVDLNGRRVLTTEASSGIQPVDFAGFGVSVFDMNVFKAVTAPRFQPFYDPETVTYSTEDAPFFRKAREAGFQTYLDHDASKLLGHVGQHTWSWSSLKTP